MRNLAEIVTVKSVEDITYNGKHYDNIVHVTLNENAFDFTTQRGCKVGDYMVFIGEGSLIPASNKNFEFLRARCYKEQYDAFAIKPMKLAGIISMGLLIPVDVLPHGKKYKVGQDVTDVLGIKKLEDLEDASPKKEKNVFKCFMYKYLPKIARLIWGRNKESQEYPSWLISKTDETNLENIPEQLDKYYGSTWYVTAKMEGQSATFILEKNKFYVCSRNVAYKKNDGSRLWKVAEKYDIEKVLRRFYEKTGIHLAIQGELCGPDIQKNIYKFTDYHLFIFNAKDLDHNKYLDYDELVLLCKFYGLEMVPVLKDGILLSEFITKDTIDKVRDEFVETLSFTIETEEKIAHHNDLVIDNKGVFHDEGVVIRTKDMKFSCKLKSREYALWFSGK